MIRIVSVALPKSPTNLAQGDEVPQIITPITRQRPSEILHLLQNDFCNSIDPKRTFPVDARQISMRVAAAISSNHRISSNPETNRMLRMIRRNPEEPDRTAGHTRGYLSA